MGQSQDIYTMRYMYLKEHSRTSAVTSEFLTAEIEMQLSNRQIGVNTGDTERGFTNDAIRDVC